MRKSARSCGLIVLLFISAMAFMLNVTAESYIEGGNEIIKKIYGDIGALKKNYSELNALDDASLKKSRRDELYISYGDPFKKTGGQEGTYIYISYSKLPMSFKTWEYVPNVFYSLKYDLFVGYCVRANDRLRNEVLKIIEKDVR